MKALISPLENNRIVEVKPSNRTFLVAEPLFWVDCPSIVTTEWLYVDTKFIAPPPPEPITITTVSMRQARLALLQSGLLATVNLAIESGTEADKITWEYATEVNSSDALVQNMALALSLTDEQIDSLFTLASTL